MGFVEYIQTLERTAMNSLERPQQECDGKEKQISFAVPTAGQKKTDNHKTRRQEYGSGPR